MTAQRQQTCGGERQRERLAKLLGVVALTAAYWFPVKRWYSWWVTTAEERGRAMPGDRLIAKPTDATMTAITVNAPPEHIWPWLVQIGYQRGGLYSYDWLDRLFGLLDRPSATRILPEFRRSPWATRSLGRQGYEADRGSYGTASRASSDLPRPRHGVGVAFCPVSDRRPANAIGYTSTERVPNTPLWWLGMRITEPAALIMTRRMLLNLKARAEALRASAPSSPAASPTTPPAGVGATG